jgi:hypothetical protein
VPESLRSTQRTQIDVPAVQLSPTTVAEIDALFDELLPSRAEADPVIFGLLKVSEEMDVQPEASFTAVAPILY